MQRARKPSTPQDAAGSQHQADPGPPGLRHALKLPGIPDDRKQSAPSARRSHPLGDGFLAVAHKAGMEITTIGL
jgi:hypothetical protein